MNEITLGDPLAAPEEEKPAETPVLVGDALESVEKPVKPKKESPGLLTARGASGAAAAFEKALMRPVFGLGQLAANVGETIGEAADYLPGAPATDNPIKLGSRAAKEWLSKSKSRLDEAADFFGADEGHDIADAAGSIVSPVNWIPGGAVAKALPAASNATKAIVAGSAAGAFDWVDDAKRYWGHKLTDIAAGATTGGVLQGAGSAISGVLKPAVQKAISVLEQNGVDVSKLTLGQLLGGGAKKFEDWLSDVIPFSGIKKAQDRGYKEFMTAPMKEGMGKINNSVDYTKSMQDIFDAANGDISKAYKEAIKSIPLVNMPAQLNKAGADYKRNFGSFAFFHNLEKTAEQWKHTQNLSGQKQASTIGDQYYGRLSHAIQEYGLKPFKPYGKSGALYADPEKVHESIKALNKAINAEYSNAKKGSVPDDAKSAAFIEALTKLRDHMRGLVKGASDSGYEKLRNADAANSAVATLREASKRAAKNSGQFTPEQLIDAIKSEHPSVNELASGSARLQRYANAAQDTFGDHLSRKPQSSWLSLAEVGAPIGAGFLGGGPHGALAAAAGVGAAVPILRGAYSPTMQAYLARYATRPGPTRSAVAGAFRNAPKYLGGASYPVADQLDSLLMAPPEE